jgi:hypothetical protein
MELVIPPDLTDEQPAEKETASVSLVTCSTGPTPPAPAPAQDSVSNRHQIPVTAQLHAPPLSSESVDSSGSFDNIMDFSSQLHFKLADIIAISKKKPIILFYGIFLFCVLVGIGVGMVYYASSVTIEETKHDVYTGPAADLQRAVEADFTSLAAGAQQLISFVTLSPNCSDLDANFIANCEQVTRWHDRIASLEVLPDNVLRYQYSSTTGFHFNFNISDDFFALDNEKYKGEILKTGIYISEPMLHGTVYGSHASYNIWLPADSYATNFGCNRLLTNCTDECYDPVKGLKYYGTVRAVVDMGPWRTGEISVLEDLTKEGYVWSISVQQKMSKDDPYVIIDSGIHTQDSKRNRPVTRSFDFGNLIVELKLAPEDGWEPTWTLPAYVAVCVVSLTSAIAAVCYMLSALRRELLLNSILPRKVIRHLASGNKSYAENFDVVTIFFSGKQCSSPLSSNDFNDCYIFHFISYLNFIISFSLLADIVNFTTISSELSPSMVVEMLDGLYNLFDTMAHKHGVYKVETIGDAYMAVAGCPNAEDGPGGALRMTHFAADVIHAVSAYRPICIGDRVLQIRVGLHSGPVVAGVVGTQMPRYCLFGDTVNTASRMESNSEPMRIHLSSKTAGLLCDQLVSGIQDSGSDSTDSLCDCCDVTPNYVPPSPASSPSKRLMSAPSMFSKKSKYKAIERIGSLSDNIELNLESRGEIPIKGKGVMETYWLNVTWNENKQNDEVSSELDGFGLINETDPFEVC